MQEKEQQYRLQYGIAQMDLFIASLLHPSSGRSYIAKVKDFFGNLTKTSTAEYDKEIRVYIINQIVDFRIKYPDIALNNIFEYLDLSSGIHGDRTYEVVNTAIALSIGEEDIKVLDEKISRDINYSFISNNIEDLDAMVRDYQSENYINQEVFLQNFGDYLNNVIQQIKKNSIQSGSSVKDTVDFEDGINEILKEMVDNDNSPRSRIQTGIKALTKMLKGGFAGSRVYVALGLAKGWKSGFLLNAALWAKDYNKLYNQETGKRAVCLMVSQENTTDETIRRIYSHYYGNTESFKDLTPQELRKKYEDVGIISSDVNDTKIVLKYKANKAITTEDLRDMIEEINNNGKNEEVVMLVHDYIARIRSTNWKINADNTKIEYGDIVNELCVIARDFDIPILTAHQLNREALKSFENAKSLGQQADIARSLNASQVGESIDIIRNCDYAFLLARTHEFLRVSPDPNVETIKKTTLHIKELASRMLQGSIDSFSHPFAENNDMCLDEDINLPFGKSIFSVEEAVGGIIEQSKADLTIDKTTSTRKNLGLLNSMNILKKS